MDYTTIRLMQNLRDYQNLLALCNLEFFKKQDAIQRVRELHKPSTGTMRSDTTCINCDHPYPCPTILILDGETEYP